MTEHQNGRSSILGFATEDFTYIINSSKWNGNLDTALKLNLILFVELGFLIRTIIECKLLFCLIEILVAF